MLIRRLALAGILSATSITATHAQGTATDDAGDYARLYVSRKEQPYNLKRYTLSPYYDGKGDFYYGRVSYAGVIYDNVKLRYDNYLQQVVVVAPSSGVNIIPDQELIDWFEYDGKHYVRYNDAFAEELFRNNSYTLLYSNYKKKTGEQPYENFFRTVLSAYEHYELIGSDGTIHKVKNAGDIISIMPDRKKEIKALVRKEHLHFGAATRAQSLVRLMENIPDSYPAVASKKDVASDTHRQSARSILSPIQASGTSSSTIITGIPAIDLDLAEHESRKNEYVASKTYVVPGVRKAKQSISDDHELDEIVVVAGRQNAVKSATMGSEKFKPQLLKNIPSALGEVDIMKIVLTLPGVKTVGEAASGYNVRGGATDQNLILFNGGTVYNPSHLFGLFTSFNSDMVEDVELFKSSIPAQYGGRISSVLNVTSKEASMQKFGGSVSIGLLTSKMNLEIPVVRNKASLLLNGRTTYSDWILKKMPEKSGYKNGTANFYDLGGVLTVKFSDYHRLKVYGYYSKDKFSFSTDNKYGYTNRNISAEWRSILNENLSLTVSGGQDHYEYFNDENMEVPSMSARLAFGIDQTWGKIHFRHRPAEGHEMTYGINVQHYDVEPGTYSPLGNVSMIQHDELQKDKALESSLYVDEEWKVNDELTLSGGLRMTMFNVLGPRDVNIYPDDELPSLDHLIETQHMTGITKTYFGPELRLSARYALRDNLSLKAGFNTMHQNIHKVSNTSVMSPTDIWKLSDNNIKPQKGWQVSAGIYAQTENKKYEASIETYYKRMTDYLNYRNAAVLIMNHHLETDVISTKGYAAGVELQLKKPHGRLNGWISYCYSRTFLKQDDKRVAMPVNDGDWFPTEYDRPHELKAVVNLKFTERYSFSGNFDYSTGRPTTVPAGKYYDRSTSSYQPYYTKRNNYRLPDYMRCDVAFNIEPTHKLTSVLHGSLSFGVYNVFARKNAYSIYYTVEDGDIKGYKLSVFGTAIPYVALNIRF